MIRSAGARLGPYEIIALIGAGGMGEVYKARDTRLNRIVAIKCLPDHLKDDPERRRRFLGEAQAVATLEDSHICVLHDIGEHEGTDFLVMEHLDGETLADRLERGALPVPQALGYAVEIAEALDKAHRHGIIHRDLKPANIMLTKAGSKLLDFGLAKLRPATRGADGKVLAFNEFDSATGYDLGLLRMNGKREAQTIMKTRFSDAHPAFSPDGRSAPMNRAASRPTSSATRPPARGGRSPATAA